MTKIDILRSYDATITEGNKALVSIWKALGGLEAKKATKIFTKECLYRVSLSQTAQDDNGDNIHDALVFCIKEYIGKLNWDRAVLVDSYSGYITFGNNIISQNFIYIAKPTDYSITVPTDFEPFKEYKNQTGVVRISDEDYDIIMEQVGYPFIGEEELEYSKEQIINLAIKPALQEYFKWLPKVEIGQYPMSVNTELDIPFPNEAYDVVHYSVQQYGCNYGTGSVLNPLLRSYENQMYGTYSISGMTGSHIGNKAPHTITSSTSNYLDARATMQAVINYTTRTHLDKYKKDGQMYARVYSTKGGTAEIHWAMRTLDFEDVEFAQLNNVRDFASCNVKILLASLRSQANSEVPGQFDYKPWITEAKTEKENIIKTWKEIVKCSSIIRGGL